MKTKPKHTPGPWTVERDGNIFDIKAPQGFTPCTTNVIDPETDAANAALIAAAPEMLEVMKDAQGLLDNASAELRKRYRAAIAKAEGK